jgi:hypothetical protein
MQENTPCSIRLLDAVEALDYGTLLAQESRSEFIRTAIKERARDLLKRISIGDEAHAKRLRSVSESDK